MTDPSSVEEIYRRVIDDTVQKLAPEFENAGVSLQVLARLQTVCVLFPLLSPANATFSSFSKKPLLLPSFGSC